MKKEIENFVETFNSSILREIEKRDNVVCMLSGGLDTRCILSTLIKHECKFTCLTYKRTDAITSKEGKSNIDVDIAKKISDEFDLDLVVKDYSDKEDHYDYAINSSKDLFFLSGFSMSEVLGMKDFGKHRIKGVLFEEVPLYIYKYQYDKNQFLPIFSKDVLESLYHIDEKYFRFKFLQYSIIKHNVPELLDIRYTCHREKLFPLLCNLYYSYLE